ncbi:hypothetical protein J437_LFUL012614 [Ladona fulva]|uniref:Transcription initiation factor IIA subunit 1 n=1 Tax=Ladona fulva TaxID=123851 RepID=A0A8K0P6H5_LADFU|nr:hypothetical protein J437_LFUL012614 [Ladona fulva]
MEGEECSGGHYSKERYTILFLTFANGKLEVSLPKTGSIMQSNNVATSSNTGGVLVLGKGPTGMVRQIDGADDSSDDDDDDEDEDDDAEEEEENDEKDEEEEEENEGGAEEEPLNSEDDVSDEDPTDLFDTDNVVVCQYDKITRSRNKWKFYLKDGIMNLGGKDFVFQRANGDAEW